MTEMQLKRVKPLVPSNKFIFMEEDEKLNPKVLEFISEEKLKSITTSMIYMGRKLTRIMAVRDFGNVKAGTIGGYLESENNLSQSGECWVDNTSYVMNNAEVSEDAQVLQHSRILGMSKIQGSSTVKGTNTLGSAIITENACIESSTIAENATIGKNIYVTDSIITGLGILNCPDDHTIKFIRYDVQLIGTNEGMNSEEMDAPHKYYPGNVLEGLDENE